MALALVQSNMTTVSDALAEADRECGIGLADGNLDNAIRALSKGVKVAKRGFTKLIQLRQSLKDSGYAVSVELDEGIEWVGTAVSETEHRIRHLRGLR